MSDLEKLKESIRRRQKSLSNMKESLRDLPEIDSEHNRRSLIGFQGTGFAEMTENTADALRSITSELVKAQTGEGGEIAVKNFNRIVDIGKSLAKDEKLELLQHLKGNDYTGAALDTYKGIANKDDVGAYVDFFKAATQLSGNDKIKLMGALAGNAKGFSDGMDTQAGYWDERARFEQLKENAQQRMIQQIEEAELKLNAEQERYKELTGSYLSPFSAILDEILKGVEQIDLNITRA